MTDRRGIRTPAPGETGTLLQRLRPTRPSDQYERNSVLHLLTFYSSKQRKIHTPSVTHTTGFLHFAQPDLRDSSDLVTVYSASRPCGNRMISTNPPNPRTPPPSSSSWQYRLHPGCCRCKISAHRPIYQLSNLSHPVTTRRPKYPRAFDAFKAGSFATAAISGQFSTEERFSLASKSVVVL
jgi:hypothetical protein